MDLKLVNISEGFDLQGSKSGLITVDSFQSMIPIALFGGNREGSTKQIVSENEEQKDWWGNKLLLPQQPQQQFNSETERTLNNVALNSQGRSKIQAAVENDLSFMSDFANIEVTVSLVGADRIKIDIQVVRPDNLNEFQFVYVWDSIKRELEQDSEYFAPIPTNTSQTNFDYNFNFDIQ